MARQKGKSRKHGQESKHKRTHKVKQDYSPIRTVIVSQGDVSDFHHIQGVVGDLIAVRIQDVGVFLSPPP